jgi:hypothetical protein
MGAPVTVGQAFAAEGYGFTVCCRVS